MKNNVLSKTIGALMFIAGTSLVLGSMVSSPASAEDDGEKKVTICHASGQADTTKYETLEISWNAVYGKNGNAGHFDENGTQKAGHEQDYFGACQTAPTTTTTIPVVPGPNYIETSHTLACGTTTITLHNVSPWIYPVSVYIDGATIASYGPTVDNRILDSVTNRPRLDGPQKDATKSRTITFAEDTGVHTVSFVVNAGSESDLYRNLPVGTMTTYSVQSDCLPPPPVYSYNLTSMCRPSETEGSLRIKNGSPTNQAYTLELSGGSTLNGTAVPGDSLRTVPWSSSSDTWILTIDGQRFTKAIGNNPACEVPTTTTVETTTTTTAEATTTTAEATTTTATTAPPTTAEATTTTIALASEAPVTPTTAGLASGGPLPPTVVVLGESGALPSTGGGTDSRLPMLGGMLLTFGLALMMLARRPADS